MIISINEPNIALKYCEEDTRGFPPIPYLSIGCRTMLTQNTWTKGDLVNGVLGAIIAIMYYENNLPPDLPPYILVEFDEYYGKTFFENFIPIISTFATWQHNKFNFTRKLCLIKIKN